MKLRNASGTVVDVDDAMAARLRARGWQPLGGQRGTSPEGLPADKEALLKIAEAEGVMVDRRWGAARIKEAIQAARITDG